MLQKLFIVQCYRIYRYEYINIHSKCFIKRSQYDYCLPVSGKLKEKRVKRVAGATHQPTVNIGKIVLLSEFCFNASHTIHIGVICTYHIG